MLSLLSVFRQEIPQVAAVPDQQSPWLPRSHTYFQVQVKGSQNVSPGGYSMAQARAGADHCRQFHTVVGGFLPVAAHFLPYPKALQYRSTGIPSLGPSARAAGRCTGKCRSSFSNITAGIF